MSSRDCVIIPIEEARQRRLQSCGKTVLSVEGLPPPSFRDAFRRYYHRIRSECQAFRKPGVVCVVVNTSGIVCVRQLLARPTSVSAAILGRHNEADIWVGGDQGISLRHLAVIVFPHEGRDEPRFRVLDLRTATAMTDEAGRRLESLEAEGPVFVRCESCALLLFPTTEQDLPWPDDAEEGWACIPERVYFDESSAEPDRWARRPRRPTPRGSGPVGPSRGAVTIVQTARAPAQVQQKLLAEGESPLGTLELRSEAGTVTIQVGARALAQGVLLGRYDRCDSHGLAALADHRISRVHLLLVRVGDEVFAIDTASTNGTELDGEEGRAFDMVARRQLTIAGRAVVCWQPIGE